MNEALAAMIDTLDESALEELAHVLRAKLGPRRPTAAERRGARLGFLAELVAEHGTDIHPRVQRRLYDEQRPAAAPRSELLVEEYRTWLKACRAAEGVRPDGRVNRARGSRPRDPSPRVKTLAYSEREIRDAVRGCAQARGRVPTSPAYERWRATQVRSATSGGAVVRLPTLSTILRHTKTWRAALAAAALDGAALARVDEGARSAALPGAAAATALPLSEALVLARAANVSLEHLGGLTEEPGMPPAADASFDAAYWKTRLREAGIGERKLLRAINLPLGPYRRLLSGSFDPPLDLLVSLANVVGATPSVLLASS